MANKSFEIQESKLRLGGVDLEAGAGGGVVIPGVTQASNYRVEEVDDRGDQTYSNFPTDSEVVVIDAALYDVLVAQGDTSNFADYTATTDGEGYIDEIQVNGRGTYTSAQATRAGGSDMYAYVGTDPDRSPFVEGDWLQIPFRPKMRAGAVETIGGGGGNGNQLVSDNEDYTATLNNDGELNIENGSFAAWNSVGDGYSTTMTPDGIDLIWNGEDTGSIGKGPAGWALNSATNKSLVVNTNGGDSTWEFTTAGGLTFPDGTTQTTAYTGQSGVGSTGLTYYVMANSDGNVVTSTDGISWSSPVAITPSGIHAVATDGNNIVYIDGSTVGFTSFANPSTATEITAAVDGMTNVNLNQITYGGGYFVVAGQCNNGSVDWPLYGYSTNGESWTFKVITDGGLQSALANNNNENSSFSDVDYNGIGFNFAVVGQNVGGGVYTTNITETFTETNYFGMVPGLQVAWNGNAWYYFNDSQGSGINTNTDPRTGGWDGPFDPWGTSNLDVGYMLGGETSDTFCGGDGVLAVSDGSGHITYSTNNGANWTVVTPMPYTTTAFSISQQNAAVITFTNMVQQPGTAPASVITESPARNNEKVVITDAGEYNGTYYVNFIADNAFTLCTDQGLTTPLDSSGFAAFSSGTVTFSHGMYIDAMDYANGYFYMGNDNDQIARAQSTNMSSWTIIDDQNNAFEYWNDFFGYTDVGASVVLSELVGDGAVASTGYKTTVYSDWNGYQGGESGSDWFPFTTDIAVGDTLTFRNGEVRTVTDVNQSPGDHTAVVWNGSVDGGYDNPRYPIVITSSVYVEAVKNTARIKPDSDAATDFDQYMDIYAGQVPVVNTPIDSKHIHMAGHTGEVELFLGTDNNYVSVKEAGTAPAGVNLHSENDVIVVDSNLRLNRKGSSWASVYGDGENVNLHNNTYDVSWATITVDDQGDYYVGGESNSYSEAIVSKISRDGELIWSKYVNGDNIAGWQLDGVAYHNNEVATLVQTQYNRNQSYYKLTVHDSESGDVKSTMDIYDTEGQIEARHMIHHSTLGWVVVGRNYGEILNTMSISSIGATGTGIIELPGSQAQINGQYPDGNSGSWSMSGTNITGVQTLQLGVGLYQAVPLTTVTGIGSGATISLIADYNNGNYGYDQFPNLGQDYQTDDEVKVLGSLLGGVDGGSSQSVTAFAITPGAQIKLYFDKATYPDLYNQLTNASYQAVYDTNYYNMVGILSQGDNWEVTLDTSVEPSGFTISFYTQYGNDAYFTIYANAGAFDGIKYALNGTPSKQTIRLDMGRAMGYGSTDFTGGSFTLGKTINAQPFVWTSSGLKKYLPSPQTNGWGYAQCVAEDTYDGGLVVGGYIDNNSNGNAFVWKLLTDGTTSWANTINNDGSAINHVAVSAVNGDIFASNGATSINKFNSSGSFIDRYETNGPYGFNAHVYLAVEDGIEYLYAGGIGGSMWTSDGGLFVSKLTTDFKVVWGRSLEDSGQSINVNYDFDHVNFVLGKGQASLVGYSHINGWNYYNGVIYTLSTKDDFETHSIGRWNLVQSGYMSWSNNNASNYSAYDLINVGEVSPTTSSMLSELETNSLSWTNYTFQYKLIDLNPTKQGVRGVEAIEFADGGVLEHNPAIIPPSVHFDSNYNWNYTLQLSDIGRCIINQTIPNSSYCQDLYITVPQNDVVPFPVGTVITLINTNDSGGSGYRIYVQPENYGNNESPKIWATGGNQNPSTWSFQGMQTATLMKISTNGWLLTANNIQNED